jgi:DNA-directed RNA polymerase specialized sigma subunit
MLTRFADYIASRVVAELHQHAKVTSERRRRNNRKPDRLAIELCQALGLDPNDVVELKLELHVGALPNLTVKHYAWDTDTEAFQHIFKDYTLQPKAD